MNKERKVIEPNAIVVFDGDVNASKLNQLFQNFQGDIIITGNLIIDEEKLSIQCDNLFVMEKIDLSNYANTGICLDGNLYVEKFIDCSHIEVNGCIYCSGSIDSFNINVAEDLYVKGNIDTNGYDINVGGNLICKNEVDAAEITVLGKISVTSRIQADSISVG